MNQSQDTEGWPALLWWTDTTGDKTQNQCC